jgi:DNA-binding response OmpR family regulator
MKYLRLYHAASGRGNVPKEIYQRVWNDAPYGAESTRAVHIRHLREKIEINPANPDM